MPIFEYQCGQCENDFEKLVLNTSEKIACPKCKSKRFIESCLPLPSPSVEV